MLIGIERCGLIVRASGLKCLGPQGNDASEVTTLRRYRNLFITIIIIIIIIIIFFLAHQHKACRQLKIKQEMTAVGD